MLRLLRRPLQVGGAAAGRSVEAVEARALEVFERFVSKLEQQRAQHQQLQ